MLKNIIYVVMVLISFASCSDKKKAFDYSQSFVNKEKSLVIEITNTEANVERYINYKQFDSIAMAGEKMEQIVDNRLQEIKKERVPDVEEAQNFREACIKYFEFIKSMYTGYKEFGRAIDDTEREKAKAKVVMLANSKQTAMIAMQTAQKKFADANGFRIEK